MKRGLVILFCLSSAATVRADEPSAVPTFHNVGLYWSPDGGEEDREVRVRFRVPGGEWRDGLPLPYLPIEGTDLERADYRGSLVDLQPGTEYEVELRLEGTGESADLRFETWSEDFPEGERIEVEASSRTLVINESGTPDAYRVYDGGGQLFEVDGRYNINVQEARYVILRNFRLRGAEQHAIRLGDNVSDIVIEDNDISAWGGRGFQREFGHNAHAAVHSNRSELTRIVVQRNRIHHPNHDSNNWGEENCRSASQCSTHPSGPQAVGLYHSSGNHVIRFNEVFSDADHYYNDIFGGGDNGSFRGYPGPDSDLYGNYLANCWDDGIEVEGGVRNVRVYANYVDHCFQAIGNAPVSIGPLYVFRNVVGRSERTPGDDARGNFLKMGFASSVDWQRGFQYVFHNTLTNRDGTGFAGFGGGSRIIRHVISRNNVLFVSPSRHSISESSRNLNNDLDFDLFSSTIPSGVEENGMRGVPDFASGTFDDDTRTADYILVGGTAGRDEGVRIANFNDRFSGEAPDIGAFEDRTMRFGVEAGQGPACTPSPEQCNGIDDNCDGRIDEGCDVEADAGMDAGMADAGIADAGAADSGVADAGVADSGAPDTGAPDATLPPLDGAMAPDPMPEGGPSMLEGGCAASSAPSASWLIVLALLALRRHRSHA